MIFVLCRFRDGNSSFVYNVNVEYGRKSDFDVDTVWYSLQIGQ